MAEYIEREAALNKAREILRGEECDCEFIPVIFEVLQGLPTADVAPVVHGRWVKEVYRDPYGADWTKYHCSLCGRVEIKKEPYCNCGAKMDLKEEL